LEAIPESRKRKHEELKTNGKRKKVNKGGISEKPQKNIDIKSINEQTIGLLVTENFKMTK